MCFLRWKGSRHFFCRLCIIYAAVWRLVLNYYFPNHAGKSRLIVQTVHLKEQNSYIHLKLEKLYYPYPVWFFPNLNFRSSILPKQPSRGVLKIWSKFTGEHPCQSAISKQLCWTCTSAWVPSCKFAAYFQNTFF